MAHISGVDEVDGKHYINYCGCLYEVYITLDEVKVVEPEGGMPRDWPWQGCDTIRATRNVGRLLRRCTTCRESRDLFCWYAAPLMAKRDNKCKLCSSKCVTETQRLYSQHNVKKKSQQVGAVPPAAAAAAAQYRLCACCRKLKLQVEYRRQSNRRSGYQSICRHCARAKVKNSNERIRLWLHAQLSRAKMHMAAAAPGSNSSKCCRVWDTVGYGLEDFKAYIEPLLTSHGWTWDDWGTGPGQWTVGHKTPCAAYDLSDPLQVRQCFALTNMFPQEARENFAGGGAIHGLSKQEIITSLQQETKETVVIDLT